MGCACEQALQEGSARGECELAQVPLEAIVSHSSEGLATVRSFLDYSKSGGASAQLGSPRLGSPRGSTPRAGGGQCMALASPRAGAGSSGFPMCLPSPFLSLVTEFGAEDDFDSGAETDWEAGSQATDLCDSCCSD